MVKINNTVHLDKMYYPSEENLGMMQIDMELEAVFSYEDAVAQLQQRISDLRVRSNFRISDNTSDLINFSQLMDIREPLSTLKSLLEHKLSLNLHGFQFWLEDIQVLEKHQIIVSRCFQSGCLVQVNVQINRREKKISIVDVLKPH